MVGTRGGVKTPSLQETCRMDRLEAEVAELVELTRCLLEARRERQHLGRLPVAQRRRAILRLVPQAEQVGQANEPRADQI